MASDGTFEEDQPVEACLAELLDHLGIATRILLAAARPICKASLSNIRSVWHH